jgi:cell division protein FtsB
MFSRRLIAFLYVLLFAGLVVGAAASFWPAWQEYRKAVAAEARSRADLAKAEAELQAREKILDRLRTDPAYVELIIRRRLGYTRPDEMVFKFDE